MLSIASNPVTGGSVRLLISSSKAKNVSATILDAKGVLVSRTNLSLTVGLNSRTLTVGNLAGGIYYVKITDEDGSEQTQTMVKQ